MQFKTIGNTKVPVIGQGTGGVYDLNVIKRGIELGMTFIDTAESYGNEEIIGQAIKGQRDKVFISTKFSPEHNGYEDVIKSCENSLKKLGIDYIDLYSMHYPNPDIPIEQTRDALIKLSVGKKIKHIGICNSSPFGLGHLEPEAIQVEYNLFDRSIEKDILPYCDDNNILLIAYSPLYRFYSLPKDRMVWLQEIAVKYQKSLSQVALNWLVSHKSVIAIPRSKDFKHQKLNAESGDFKLTEEDLKKIDDLFKFEVSYIAPELIHITTTGKYPQTLQEALGNITHWAVSPEELSKDLGEIKPIKIERREDYFELLEGGLRYWAWRIKWNKPIPSIIIGEDPLDRA